MDGRPTPGVFGSPHPTPYIGQSCGGREEGVTLLRKIIILFNSWRPLELSIVHHPQGWPGLLAGLDHGALHRTGEGQLTKNKLLWWIRFLITSIVMGGASGGNILPSSWVFRCQVWDRFAFILNVILYLVQHWILEFEDYCNWKNKLFKQWKRWVIKNELLKVDGKVPRWPGFPLTSTKFVHRCVSWTKVNKGKQR